MEKIVIYGTGKHAELCAFYMKEFKLYDLVAFTIEKKIYKEKKFRGLPVVIFEDLEKTYPPDSYKLYVAVGPIFANRIRKRIYLVGKSKGYGFGNIVVPGSATFSDLTIGENTYIEATSFISPLATIGNNVIIIASFIGHHSKVGDHAFISCSNIGGNTTIGESTFIGIHSAIAPNLTLGPSTIIGMGSKIREDTPPNSVYIEPKTKKTDIDPFKINLF